MYYVVFNVLIKILRAYWASNPIIFFQDLGNVIKFKNNLYVYELVNKAYANQKDEIYNATDGVTQGHPHL